MSWKKITIALAWDLELTNWIGILLSLVYLDMLSMSERVTETQEFSSLWCTWLISWRLESFNYLNLTLKYSVCHCSWFISYYVKIWFRQRYITQNHCIHVRSFQCISASQPANSIAYRFARCEFLIFFRFLSELNVA